MKKKNLKPIPLLTSDEEAEKFIETADLNKYDLSGFKRRVIQMIERSVDNLKKGRAGKPIDLGK